MRTSRLRAAGVRAGALGFCLLGFAAYAQDADPLVPTFSIWDAKFGMNVADIPEIEVNDISCGTNGGPPSTPLKTFDDFMTCPAEPSGLREIYFSYDDELDYISKAMENEYKVVQGGTTVYAHPVIVTMLVDEAGLVQGIRIVSDDRISIRDRRQAVTLAKNFKARFVRYDLVCEDIPPAPGENPVGNLFQHEVCTGYDPGSQQYVRIEARYLRKKGQEALNPETQQPNDGYFESTARLDFTQDPYEPVGPSDG